MTAAPAWWRLPLVGRELIELSKRRSTYWRRTVLAGVLLLELSIVPLFFRALQPGMGASSLGWGGVLAGAVITTLTIAVVAIGPALSASSMTSERDNGTLPLLLITPLGIGRLVLQKWISQLLALFTLLLVALPILVLGYLYGGIGAMTLLSQMMGLLLLVMEIAAMGLLAGCWCRSPMAALVLAYAGTLLAGFILPEICVATFFRPSASGARIATVYMLLQLIPIVLLLLATAWRLARMQDRADPSAREVVASSPAGGTARPRKSRQRDLPAAEPLRWRCTASRSWTAGWGVWAIWGIVLVAVFENTGAPEHSIICDLTLAALLMATAFRAAGVLPSARANQTLEVLLSTPLEPKDIMKQLASGLAHGHWKHLVGLAAVSILDAILRHEPVFISAVRLVTVIIVAAGLFSIFLSLGLWSGAGTGSLQRALMRALLRSSLILVLVPIVALVLVAISHVPPLPPALMFSPLVLLVWAQVVSPAELLRPGPVAGLVIGLIVLGILALSLRRIAIERGEELLGASRGDGTV